MAVKKHDLEILAQGFSFLEGPRWRNGRLWVSDMRAGSVYSVSEAGERTSVASVPSWPSGLGFLQDGSLVVVGMNDKKIYRVADKQISVYCDLSKIVCAPLNDMVVASDGRCYVGDIGYDFYAGAPRATGGITLIEPDGSARRVMSGMECPNGMLIREGGRKLCVAESFANRVMEFDRDSLGNLSNPRLLIELPREVPDGICLADDGCIWVACYMGSRFVCVDPSGRMVAQVMLTGRNAVACQLGGGDGRTLFCLTYEGSFEDMSAGVPGARIEVARVDVKAAGSP